MFLAYKDNIFRYPFSMMQVANKAGLFTSKVKYALGLGQILSSSCEALLDRLNLLNNSLPDAASCVCQPADSTAA